MHRLACAGGGGAAHVFHAALPLDGRQALQALVAVTECGLHQAATPTMSLSLAPSHASSDQIYRQSCKCGRSADVTSARPAKASCDRHSP